MRIRPAAALALALCSVTAPQAHADGLPLPVENSPTGVSSPGGTVRYLTADSGGRTMVVSQTSAEAPSAAPPCCANAS